jgi:MFS superfamily sulfate permease-like transporter
VISIICISFLISLKIFVNEKYKKQLRNIPIPTELIVIIVGTTISYFLNLNQNYGLAIVGQIPSG